MNWPIWIAFPVLAFYWVPFWLRIALAVSAIVWLGTVVFR